MPPKQDYAWYAWSGDQFPRIVKAPTVGEAATRYAASFPFRLGAEINVVRVADVHTCRVGIVS